MSEKNDIIIKEITELHNAMFSAAEQVNIDEASKYLHNDSGFRVVNMAWMFNYDETVKAYGEVFNQRQGQKFQMD